MEMACTASNSGTHHDALGPGRDGLTALNSGTCIVVLLSLLFDVHGNSVASPTPCRGRLVLRVRNLLSVAFLLPWRPEDSDQERRPAPAAVQPVTIARSPCGCRWWDDFGVISVTILCFIVSA